MINCNRCGQAFLDAHDSFWREPVLVCSSCGARHQKESRLSRLIAWMIALPLILVLLFCWFALAILLAQLIYFEGKLTLVNAGAAIGLIVIPIYPGKYLFATIRELLSQRKILCLEK